MTTPMTYHETACNGIIPKKKKKVDLLDQAVFLKWVNNVWAETLTPSEFKVVMAVHARTLSWGKVWEVVPVRHLVDGIVDSRGGMHFRGTGLSKRTIVSALSRLIEQGYLLARKFGKTRLLAINTAVMATGDDPAHERVKLKDRLRVEAIRVRKAFWAVVKAAERRWRDTGSEEDHEAWRSLMGPEKGIRTSDMAGMMKKPRSRCGDASQGTENNDSEGAKIAPIRNEHIPSRVSKETSLEGTPSGGMLRTPRAKKIKPEATAEDGAMVTTGHRRRKRAVRRGQDPDTDIRPVADFAMKHAPQPREEPATPAPGAEELGNTTLGDILKDAAQRSAKAQKKQRQRGRNGPQNVIKCWADAYHRNTGQTAEPFRIQALGKVKASIGALNIPDPNINIYDVFDWVTDEWGYALTVAIPFMVKDEEKRSGLLEGLPARGLVMHFLQQFVDAYASIYHGSGVEPANHEDARAAQAIYKRNRRRAGEIETKGYDALPVQYMQADELQSYVERLAKVDPAARDVLEQQEEHKAMMRKFKRRYGRDARQEYEKAIMKIERQAGLQEQQDSVGHLFPTASYDD